ncbi:hypothetical protein E2P64_06865 [Candidatus Bathyarchaeota archaeon]|nr:hypothetical protein E2P64_06865 [Candidatus Bathyarchaeota archaeon]
MTIGPDIKEAIVEVGTKYTILRDSGNITGEYLDYETNAQVTKPFIREFFLESTLCYDSRVVPGDVIQFVTTSEKYIVMNHTPEMFENSIITYATVLYKANVTFDIFRPSEVRDSHTYHVSTIWSLIGSSKAGLLTSPLYGIDLDTDEQLGLIGLQLHELYVPSSYGIKVLDRLRLSNGEYYRVEALKKRRYQDVDVVEVGQDTRATTTSTTTTTSTSTSTSTTTTA